MPPVSDEKIRRAKNVGILAYLRIHEPESLRKSRGANEEYYLADHDSLKISNGKFHWFSRNIGGYSALDFLVKVRGMGFIDAVLHLSGDSAAYEAMPLPVAVPLKQTKPSNPFALPPANANNDRVYAYLRGRGIDGDIIRHCISSGVLYENTRNNCIFVGYDGDIPKFAFERGTADGLKKDISGSDKRFSFVLPPKSPDSRNLMVSESPIDCLSHAVIHKLDGIIRVPAKPSGFVGEGGTAERSGSPTYIRSSEATPTATWEGYRLSLGGVGATALTSFLERHPMIENVCLCLDADQAGKEAAGRIIRGLLSDKRFSRLKISDAPPPIGKDYSDTLQVILQLYRDNSRPGCFREAANFI
jgi:hypothetical protein